LECEWEWAIIPKSLPIMTRIRETAIQRWLIMPIFLVVRTSSLELGDLDEDLDLDLDLSLLVPLERLGLFEVDLFLGFALRLDLEFDLDLDRL